MSLNILIFVYQVEYEKLCLGLMIQGFLLVDKKENELESKIYNEVMMDTQMFKF